MATAVGHEACPQCRKDGHDFSGDNLARYADGGAYCFRCGYYENGTGVQVSSDGIRRSTGSESQPRGACSLPTDINQQLPRRASDWLSQYSLDENDIKVNTILWSEGLDKLIFPYFVEENLVAWQGRSFSEKSRGKWVSYGDIKNLYYFRGNPWSDEVIIVEDIISAIRIGKIPGKCAMPLFGSVITSKQILTLSERFKSLRLWLDKDKELYARQRAQEWHSVGIDIKAIVSELDPKCYNSDNLESFMST